jgi:hypothetical protein
MIGRPSWQIEHAAGIGYNSQSRKNSFPRATTTPVKRLVEPFAGIDEFFDDPEGFIYATDREKYQ